MENSEALPFISFDGKFKVDEEAIKHLESFKSKIGIVAVCGKY